MHSAIARKKERWKKNVEKEGLSPALAVQFIYGVGLNNIVVENIKLQKP